MASPRVYIGTRITPELNNRLEATAQRENNQVSAVVRRLLSAALDREEEALGIAPVVARPRRARKVRTNA
jgi:hypothetical protein